MDSRNWTLENIHNGYNWQSKLELRYVVSIIKSKFTTCLFVVAFSLIYPGYLEYSDILKYNHRSLWCRYEVHFELKLCDSSWVTGFMIIVTTELAQVNLSMNTITNVWWTRLCNLSVRVIISSGVDRWFELMSSLTKGYTVISCFSTKHASLRSNNKDWLLRS